MVLQATEKAKRESPKEKDVGEKDEGGLEGA